MLLSIDLISNIAVVAVIGALTSSIITIVSNYIKKKSDKSIEVKINDKILKFPSNYSDKEIERLLIELLNQIKPRVFISYANQDKEIARRLADKLRENGFDIWFDEFNLNLGDNLVERLSEGIKHSTYFLLVITKNFTNSKWISKEFEFMLNSIDDFPNRKIIPLIFDKEVVLPEVIRDKIYLDYTSDTEKGDETLIRFLKMDDKKTTANMRS